MGILIEQYRNAIGKFASRARVSPNRNSMVDSTCCSIYHSDSHELNLPDLSYEGYPEHHTHTRRDEPQNLNVRTTSFCGGLKVF